MAILRLARGLAAKAPKKGGSAGAGGRKGGSAATLETGWDALNLWKEGQVPVRKHPADYPDWLWKLGDAQPSREELLRGVKIAFSQGGVQKVVQDFSATDIKRLLKLENRKSITEKNAQKAS